MNNFRLVFALSILITCAMHKNTVAAESPIIQVGEFERIYDPSVGEDEKWWINDHTFVMGDDGTWHLIGITREQPDNPSVELMLDDVRVAALSAEGKQALLDEMAEVGRKMQEAVARGEKPVSPLGEGEEIHFAHATSANLTQRPWAKQPFALTYAPDLGETHIWAPHIVKNGDTYYMYFNGGGEKDDQNLMQLATTTDLKTWMRHPENPMLVDGFHARDPMVLKVGDKWIMYYTANSDPKGGNHIVAYATSADLIHWEGRGTAFTDPTAGTYGGPTESPFVVRRGPYYYLLLSVRKGSPPGGYAFSEVFRSTDPLHWDLDDKVGEIKTHAGEFIRDRDGKWYVSHCGWYQGGVYLAPLVWNDGIDDADTSMPIPVVIN